MDPVTLIVTALAAGAASAQQDDAKEYVLEKHASAPEIWRPVLQQELTESGAGSDAVLVAAARELLRLLDAQGPQAAGNTVTVEDSQGVQIGDHNTQVNIFGTVTAGRSAYVADRDIIIRRD
jgi:hypothetical protein